MPMEDPNKFIRFLMSEKRSSNLKDTDTIQDKIKNLYGDIDDYYTNFLGQQLMHHNVFFKFHPDNCRKTLLSKTRTLIGISPQDNEIAQALAKDL